MRTSIGISMDSPTGRTAPPEFFEKVVALAKEKEFVVVQDAAHIVLSFDSEPLSFLAVPGAKEVGVETHSMSKGFDMIGWRIGWVCGNATLVRAFADVKDNCDSGQFPAIQHAAVAALDDDSIADGVQKKYRRRAQKLVNVLKDCGFNCEMPGGTYFVYTPAPKAAANGVQFENAEQASQHLITQASIVTVPWDEAGPFLRFSVTYEAAGEQAEDALMLETAQRIKDLGLVF